MVVDSQCSISRCGEYWVPIQSSGNVAGDQERRARILRRYRHPERRKREGVARAKDPRMESTG